MWNELSQVERIIHLRILFKAGHTQLTAAHHLGTNRANIQNFCARHKIKSKYPQGAQLGNTNAQTHGQGTTTIKRKTRITLERVGRDLNTCERCGANDPFVPYPRHHKDRNRLNNSPDNLEVLCHYCHNKEHELERTRNELGQYM